MTTLPKPGVYRIVQSGDQGQPQILTIIQDGDVTISPAGSVSEKQQEFRLEIREDKVAIQYPTQIWPSRSLSYEGEPEAGKRIKLGPPTDFPSREWHLEHAPHIPGPFKPYFISVPGKDLRIAISPKLIYPPQLELSDHRDSSWIFELVRP